MKSCLCLIFAILAVIAGGAALAQQGPAELMIPGLWEITMQTHAPVTGPPITHTVCIDKALVSRPQPPRLKASEDCQVQPDAAAANETAYTIRCGKLGRTSSWRFVYLRDRFEGTATITTPAEEIRQTYTAKRIAPCDNTPPPQVTSTAN